jgi:hypothetical protein
MDHPREAVAIKGFPSASLIPNKDASEHVLRAQGRFRATMQTMPTMRNISSVEETLHIQCTGRKRAGQGYARTVVHKSSAVFTLLLVRLLRLLRLSFRLCYRKRVIPNPRFARRLPAGRVRNLLFLLIIIML